MNKEDILVTTFMLLWICALVFLLGFSVGNVVERRQYMNEIIEHGHGEWVCNPTNGTTQFRWK